MDAKAGPGAIALVVVAAATGQPLFFKRAVGSTVRPPLVEVEPAKGDEGRRAKAIDVSSSAVMSDDHLILIVPATTRCGCQ